MHSLINLKLCRIDGGKTLKRIPRLQFIKFKMKFNTVVKASERIRTSLIQLEPPQSFCHYIAFYFFTTL